MIVAIVAGLSIGPAAGALHALEDRSFLHKCEIELQRLICTSQAVAMEGVGSSRVVDIDLSSNGRLRMISLTIGGERGDPWMASTVLELSSGRQMIRSASEPFVWIASTDLDQLVIGSTVFRALLHYDIVDGRSLVICEVLPWTS